MTISNAAIKAGDQVFQYLNGVLKLMGTATQDGTITFTFDEDPVFTVATPIVIDSGGVTPPSGGGTGSSDGSTDPFVDTSVATDGLDSIGTANSVTLPYTGSTVSMPIGVALVFLVLGGAMVLATRRKRVDQLESEAFPN